MRQLTNEQRSDLALYMGAVEDMLAQVTTEIGLGEADVESLSESIEDLINAIEPAKALLKDVSG